MRAGNNPFRFVLTVVIVLLPAVLFASIIYFRKDLSFTKVLKAYQATTESTAMRTNSSGQNVTDSNGKEVSYTDSDNFWRNLGIVAIVALIVIVIVIKVIVDKKKGKKEE